MNSKSPNDTINPRYRPALRTPASRTLLTVGLAIALAGAAGPALAQDPQLITLPLSRPGEPLILDINILSARIEVIGEAREDVQLEVSAGGGKRRIVTPSGTRELANGAFAVEVEEEDNVVEVDADWRADTVQVVARIPRRADLELTTTNNGEITVRDVTGALVLNNVNGPITATGITGTVIAESINEDIDVSFDAIQGDGAMSFASVNGTLSVGLPTDAAVQLHIDSAEGEITSDFEVDVMPSEPTITREEDESGGVEIRVESVIVANVNGGGTVIRMKTLNGDINIRKSTQ
jgi:hypothetical protein